MTARCLLIMTSYSVFVLWITIRLRRSTMYIDVANCYRLSSVVCVSVGPSRGRFLLIFALDKLNVCHISTSALVDLLT